VIGNGVYVGPNSAVLGKITVGDGAKIGANSVVTQDVPAHSHVWPAPVVITPAEGAPADHASVGIAGV
jgi:serine O-acetyltransferase